jgi:hypothetical protein
MITFRDRTGGNLLLIGGSLVLGGLDGGVGPMPRYSISREDSATGDGTYVSSRYNINITGTATLKAGDNQNLLVEGERQRAIQGEALIKLLFNMQTFPRHGVGLLEIQSYGASTSNTIKFMDARLVSLDLPEQNDENGGVQNLEYNFTFEAYQIGPDDSTNDGSAGAAKVYSDDHLCLSSAEENWDLTVNEDQMSIAQADIATFGSDDAVLPRRTFTLTHTISAVGHKKFYTNTTADVTTDGEAWRQAVKFVKNRMNDTTDGDVWIQAKNDIVKDIMGQARITNFSPYTMDKTGDAEALKYDLYDDGFRSFNHVRQVQSDTSAGSYSITDTWTLSDQDLEATIEIEANIESGEDKPESVVTIQGSVQGLDKKSSTYKSSNKYTQAKTAWSALEGSLYTIANALAGSDITIRDVVLSESISRNKLAGVINFTRVYDDRTPTVEGALTEDVTVTYDNEGGTNKVVAILGVLSRAAGPIIQDMNTTKERRVSVSVDLVMKKANRASKPTGAYDVASAYTPTNGKEETRTESWSPRTGQYNFSIGWVFNE